jgi:glycosyltransferase involved in cell wall biosynthesis
MRVALVYRNFNLGGSLERDSVLLARGLVARGVEVHAYCNPRTSVRELLPDVAFHDVAPLTVSQTRLGYALECGSFALAATRAVRRDRSKFDIVDVGGIAAWEHDVVTVHAVVSAEQRRWPDARGREYKAARARAWVAPLVRPQSGIARTIVRLQLRPGHFKRIIAVTDQVRDDLIAAHRVPSDLIDVIAPPVDLPTFGRRNGLGMKKALGLEAGEQVLLFVGHDFERKGLGTAIAALAALASNTHLVVVGGGDAALFRSQAERLGITKRVHFVGATDEPEAVYVEADLFVLPTKGDPWGIPLVEAMASGIPVVTTAEAGAASVVREANAGIVMPPDTDASDLREAIAGLLENPSRRSAMGEAGRLAAERFGVERQTEATLDVYRRAMEESPQTAKSRSRRNRKRDILRIASFPSVQEMNPYQRLLYEHLAVQGFQLEPDARLDLVWLWRARDRVKFLHFHWPHGLYTFRRGRVGVSNTLSWVKLARFQLRLAAARALGYRIVWTIHQVYPHEQHNPRRDRMAARMLARSSHLLIAHDGATAQRAREELGHTAAEVEIVPHGSYAGVYPPGRERDLVRRELGIDPGTFTFLAFGELRRNKQVELLVEGFRSLSSTEVALVVAGFAKVESVASEIRRRRAEDDRIKLRLNYLRDHEVRELFDACDAAVIPRTDGGTSGALVLALSLGLPVVAADLPAYTELIGRDAAGWLFRPDDRDSLRAALEAASSAEDAVLEAKRAAARRQAERLHWPDIAERTAALLRSVDA